MIIDCISDLHGDLPKLDGGDVHEGYGREDSYIFGKRVCFVNASVLNGDYDLVNKPIRVIL